MRAPVKSRIIPAEFDIPDSTCSNKGDLISQEEPLPFFSLLNLRLENLFSPFGKVAAAVSLCEKSPSERLVVSIGAEAEFPFLNDSSVEAP